MFLRVGLCGFGRMMLRVLVMSMSHVGVVRGLLMVATLMMLCRFLVVTSRLLMMFCGLQVLLYCLFGHLMFLLVDCCFSIKVDVIRWLKTH